jgi:hypothetical protein
LADVCFFTRLEHNVMQEQTFDGVPGEIDEEFGANLVVGSFRGVCTRRVATHRQRRLSIDRDELSTPRANRADARTTATLKSITLSANTARTASNSSQVESHSYYIKCILFTGAQAALN